jgi:hypothetical protein
MRFHDNLARYGVRALAQLLGLDQSLQDCLLFYRTDRNLPVVAWEDGHCTLQICTPAYGGDYTPPCKLLVPLVHLSSKSDHNADRPQRLRGCVLEPLSITWRIVIPIIIVFIPRPHLPYWYIIGRSITSVNIYRIQRVRWTAIILTILLWNVIALPSVSKFDVSIRQSNFTRTLSCFCNILGGKYTNNLYVSCVVKLLGRQPLL